MLFGRERTGLENDDIALADAVVTVPASPAHASLNLAQAVLIAGYEWYQLGAHAEEIRRSRKGAVPATREELVGLFAHLEGALDDSGFLRLAHKRPRMVRNLRNIFSRAGLTDQEVRTLRGVIVSLTTFARRPKT
jgi:tRNA/rRNA methyltransferase